MASSAMNTGLLYDISDINYFWSWAISKHALWLLLNNKPGDNYPADELSCNFTTNILTISKSTLSEVVIKMQVLYIPSHKMI